MKNERQVEKIISKYLPAIESGAETLDSVMAKFPQLEAELRPRLEAALWLRDARFALATRPGFIHDSRKYLETKIANQAPRGFWQQLARKHSPQRWAFNIAAPIIVALLLVLIVNSAIFTARMSIPGETLYPAKLVLEDAQLAMTFNDARRTDLYLQYSRQRALEFVELVMEGKYDRLPAAAEQMEAELIASLRSLNDIHADNASADAAMVDAFRDSLNNQMLMLNVLKTTTPPSAHNGIELAIQVTESGLMALR